MSPSRRSTTRAARALIVSNGCVFESRHNYLVQVSELATATFIGPDNKPTIRGLIIAGAADLKSELHADLLDPRLKVIVVKLLDLAYGGKQGLEQAISNSADVLTGLRYLEEKKLLSELFSRIARDSGGYCLGPAALMRCLEVGAVHTVLVHENLNVNQFASNQEDAEAIAQLAHSTGSSESEAVSVHDFDMLSWLVDNSSKMGVEHLEFICDRTPEGSQFCKGLGGIAGLLRYQVVDPSQFEDLDGSTVDDDDAFL
eukprot:GILJ01006795.1.p1 GENE.GILJ01006795.1~~GILJ01006795.1.p1  ORF type:complete len:257 (-),score=57.63 GILJ01006795.1:181-951(-)